MKEARKIMIEVVVTLLAVATASCVSDGDRRVVASWKAEVEKSDITAATRQWADSVAMTMDTAALAAQTLMPAVYAADDVWTMRQLACYAERGVGGIILLKGNTSAAAHIADTLSRISRVPPFMAIDAEWGLHMRLEDAPAFPANGRLSPKVEDQLMYEYGREVARECRQIGIDMVLGPVLDVSDSNTFIGVRSLGGDPRRVSELGLAYGRGLHDGNVVAVAKHFPGHGCVGTDSHHGKGMVMASLQRLDTVDLVPFRAWTEAGMPAVMAGHLAVPAIDSRMLPAAVSPTVIGDLLRGDLRFDGLVLTDALNMGGAEGYGADKALAAGADIVLAPADTDREISNVINAVREGRLPMEQLRRHVARILFYKLLYRQTESESLAPIRVKATDSIASRLSGR